MNIILQTLKELSEKLYKVDLAGKDLGEFLDECQLIFSDSLLRYTAQKIEEIDEAIFMAKEERGDWKSLKKGVERSVETKHGLLSYKRRYYRNSSTKNHCFIADLALGVEAYQRIEDTLGLALVEKASELSYRAASKEVCQGRVSASSVGSYIRKIEIPDQEELERKAVVDELHIQADEDHVHLQRTFRRSAQIRFAAIHEPKVHVYGSRYKLKGRHIISSVSEKPEEFGERVLDTLDALYELDKVKGIYCHGDGAAWINTLSDSLPGSIQILDMFHLEKKLLGVCRGDKRLRNHLRKSLNPWDDKKLTKELEMLVDSDVCSEDSAKELWGYLQNNKESIINNYTEDHGGSCAEGLVSHVFSKRFSRDPLSWGVTNLRKLSEVRVHLINGGRLNKDMLKKKEVEIKEVPLLLSAAKANALSSSKNVGDWSVSIPGIELSSGAIGAIIRGINRGGILC